MKLDEKQKLIAMAATFTTLSKMSEPELRAASQLHGRVAEFMDKATYAALCDHAMDKFRGPVALFIKGAGRAVHQDVAPQPITADLIKRARAGHQDAVAALMKGTKDLPYVDHPANVDGIKGREKDVAWDRSDDEGEEVEYVPATLSWMLPRKK